MSAGFVLKSVLRMTCVRFFLVASYGGRLGVDEGDEAGMRVTDGWLAGCCEGSRMEVTLA